MSDLLDNTPTDPVTRLTLALADYSVRYLAPVLLEEIATEIESCGYPVRPGSSATEWQSVTGIVASFKRVARELAGIAPLAPETADHAYKLLDQVRTGIDWIKWPGENRRDDLHHLLIKAMMPAAHARAACQLAHDDPHELQQQYLTPLSSHLSELLGQTIRSVRETCSAVEATGKRADDLAAFTDMLSATR